MVQTKTLSKPLPWALAQSYSLYIKRTCKCKLTQTYRFTSSKNTIKPPLSILKELAEFLEVQILDKGYFAVPPWTLGHLSGDIPPFILTLIHHFKQTHQHLKNHDFRASSLYNSEITTYKMTLAMSSLPLQNIELPRWFTACSLFLRVTAETERKSDSGLCEFFS